MGQKFKNFEGLANKGNKYNLPYVIKSWPETST